MGSGVLCLHSALTFIFLGTPESLRLGLKYFCLSLELHAEGNLRAAYGGLMVCVVFAQLIWSNLSLSDHFRCRPPMLLPLTKQPKRLLFFCLKYLRPILPVLCFYVCTQRAFLFFFVRAGADGGHLIRLWGCRTVRLLSFSSWNGSESSSAPSTAVSVRILSQFFSFSIGPFSSANLELCLLESPYKALVATSLSQLSASAAASAGVP